MVHDVSEVLASIEAKNRDLTSVCIVAKPYKRFQCQGHEQKTKKRTTVVASLMLLACLVVEIIQH